MSGHKTEQLKGKIKQAVGEATGDKSLKLEGQLDQGSAAVKSAIDDATEKVAEKITPLADKALDAMKPKSDGSSTSK